jgi:hypothetical protein
VSLAAAVERATGRTVRDAGRYGAAAERAARRYA